MIYSVLIDVAIGLYNLETLILNINYCVVESETQCALDILNCLNVYNIYIYNRNLVLLLVIVYPFFSCFKCFFEKKVQKF
jgi:hypothetical protein